MLERRSSFALLVVLLLSCAGVARAESTEIYLTFENPAVIGAGTGDHANEIPLIAFHQEVGGGRGPRSQAPFMVKAFTGRHTDDVVKLCFGAKEIGKATLRVYRSDGSKEQLVYEVVLQRVSITNIAITGGLDGLPIDEMTLSYGSMQINTFVVRPDGTLARESADVTFPERAH